MTDTREFRPDWTSPPGDTITDLLVERSLSTMEFAELIGQTPEETNNLLLGRSTITLGIARQLERVLGASVEFWMSRDFQYREDVAGLTSAERGWIAEVPIGDMIKFGWLKPVPRPSEELAACLQFFNVPSVQAWNEQYAEVNSAVAFRTSLSYDSRPAAVAAWLRQGEIEAEEIECNPWDVDAFQESLPEIRSLTRRKDPSQFIPQLQYSCAKKGVAVVVVRAPGGVRASGATRFLSPQKALLMLSFRFLSDDQFWFSFFHEAGHLVLHGNQRFFLEDEDTPSTAEEQEANDFASNLLIPSNFQQEMLDLPANARAVVRFAVRVGVSPGIVVGQLQHNDKIPHNWLNRLKRRYSWES